MKAFKLIPVTDSKTHQILEKGVVEALIAYHKKHGSKTLAQMDIWLGLAAVQVFRHLQAALDEAGLEIVKRASCGCGRC